MVGDRREVEHAPTAAASSTTRRHSLVRRAFWPSPLEERPGPQRIHAFARARAIVLLGAILFDLGIYLVFRTSSSFDLHTLDWFVAINVPLLAIAAALCWFPLSRKGRWYMHLSIASLAIEVFTCVTYIQLTGSVSSYFLLALPTLIIGYRLYGTYRLGLLVYAVCAVMHAAVVVLEGAGALRPAALFVADPGAIYAVPLFRISAAVSIQMILLTVFVVANMLSRALREKETALDEAQRDLVRVAAEVQPGRLSGHTLDGRYQLGELLGRGGMGEVYQAVRTADGADVAVKILYAHLCEADDLARFRREAAIAAKLPADHVARVFDVGHAVDGGHHYLVMELLRGEDLGTLLRRRRKLPFDELLPIVEQLAVALASAHALGVVHRDLKPQNVFVVSIASGVHVKLLDFGVARLVEGSDLTQSAMLIGSPGYLAPEQVDASFGTVGPRADVFALGAIVYRMLTGQAAFPARNAAAAAYEAVHREPPAPSMLDATVSPDLDSVIALALAKHPDQRYATPGELARDLRAACSDSLDPASRARADALDGRSSAPALAPTLASSN